MANTTIIPYIRANEVEFVARNLKPDRTAHFFFDETNIDNFIQKASSIVIDAANTATAFSISEGLYCSDMRGYANVIATSTTSPNTIYVNDNYLSLNVNFFGANVSFSATDFNKGDIVFTSPGTSSNAAANTFSGRVEYFNSTDKVLVVRPLNGAANTSSGANTLFNLGKGTTANIASVVKNARFNVNAVVVSTSNSSKKFLVTSYTHNHGVLASVNATSTVLDASANVPSTAAGNLIYLTSGSGLGVTRLVNSVTANQYIVLNAAVTGTSGNTTYSLGTPTVDDVGTLTGIFQIPETDTFKFKTGERLFTIVDTTVKDDPDAQMKATTIYIAAGLAENVVPTVTATTPVGSNTVVTPPRFTTVSPVPARRRDPVAQTFFTPQPTSDKKNYGIFVSSVDLFFKSKPDTANSDPELPVSLKIVSTDNGYPTDIVISEVTIPCSSVKTTNGITTFPNSANNSTLTKFTFSDPVYLAPDQEYALVVESDSPSYEVWISELGQSILGDPLGRRISEQPYAGSFFRSQNSSTWTPYQNEDLMFVIHKAVFDNATTQLLFNVLPPASNIGVHSMVLHSSDLSFPNTSISYGFESTVANTLAQEVSFTTIEKDKLYNFSSDLTTSSKNSNRTRIIRAGNANSMLVQATISTADQDISPLLSKERMSLITEEYLINDGKLSNTNITITNPGGKHNVAANITVTISAPQLYADDPTSQATANVLTAGLSTIAGVADSNNIIAINIVNPGRGYVESPTITITDNSPWATSNATAVIISENEKSGGNALARYQTKKIALADGFDAGDMRVYVTTIRPQGTHIVAYYKVLSSSDPDAFETKKWQRMYLVEDLTSIDTTTPVELIFKPSATGTQLSYVESGVTYPLGGKFKYFAIKLVMLAADPSVPPVVRNIRAIALPAG